jgi:hypothetical protein
MEFLFHSLSIFESNQSQYFCFTYLDKYGEISTPHHAGLLQQALERVSAAYNPKEVKINRIHHHLRTFQQFQVRKLNKLANENKLKIADRHVIISYFYMFFQTVSQVCMLVDKLK